MNTEKAKKFLESYQINERSVYDKKDNEHLLDCLLEEYHQEQLKLLYIGEVNHSETNVKRQLKDFDIWYMPCSSCGFDEGKSTQPKEGNKTCWKCGDFIKRDFTNRALKK